MNFVIRCELTDIALTATQLLKDQLCLQAAVHWEKALGLNPLFPQGWFALGYCCLKTKHQQRALEVTKLGPLFASVTL